MPIKIAPVFLKKSMQIAGHVTQSCNQERQNKEQIWRSFSYSHSVTQENEAAGKGQHRLTVMHFLQWKIHSSVFSLRQLL